ncbi:MAG TPA: hypothetical protein VGM88_20985 [Kofleriaceae bacterium]|jgi:hypothetical protein
MPEVVVIAGPSGSGKSRHFPARSFGFAFFNVDDRCAELLHDNTELADFPRLVRHYLDRRVVFEEPPLPAWVP